MKLIWILFVIVACSPHLTEKQIRNDSPVHEAFDTLAAYRKYPGIKNVEVKGYIKKDSTVVKPYKRSKMERKL
jgi:hypothetical protein